MKNLFVLFILCSLSVLAGNISASIIKNATMVQFYPQGVWAFKGSITFREPDLAGGGASYQRIIIFRAPLQNDPVERYIEIGWVKGFPGFDLGYVPDFAVLVIYGSVGSNSNRAHLFRGIPGQTYEYIIHHYKQSNNINCIGQNRFHTLGIHSRTFSGLLLTLCRSETRFTTGTSVSWGGETTAGSMAYLPDMVGRAVPPNPRVANRYFKLQTAYLNPINPSALVWERVVFGLPVRQDCPYRIIPVQSSFFTCGVEDGIRSPSVYQSYIPCPRISCP
jgi:hypothetical protein